MPVTVEYRSGAAYPIPTRFPSNSHPYDAEPGLATELLLCRDGDEVLEEKTGVGVCQPMVVVGGITVAARLSE